MLVIEPKSTSAWVTVWLAVQVSVFPGVRLVTSGGQITAALSSVTVNGPLSVTLPVFFRS